jgi:hypothetical protein
MNIVRKIKRTLRGEVPATAAARELLRRSRARVTRSRERARLSKWQQTEARLQPEFATMAGVDLLTHFRNRSQPVFLPGFSSRSGDIQKALFTEETRKLMVAAEKIVDNHSWPLLGIGERNFGPQINWHRDPLSEVEWPLEYHADLNLFRNDGSDVRVLWELNRLAHFLTLARAFVVSNDERFSAEFFAQLESWHAQNPYGMGANWNCAMEVALRATNLLGAFQIFQHSSLMDEQKLARLLAILDQHGHFIRRHLEFSYIGTSNHYLSDIVGLVWLGTMLPELLSASEWREFGLREMLREMDKQVLAEGADFESSTGYHRLVLELFLYTFILCRENDIEIEDKYWNKLRAMLHYVRAYLRPDGRAPLIGDSDSGQFFPITKRAGDDHAYVLAIGAVVMNESTFETPDAAMPEELVWILGDQSERIYQKAAADQPRVPSQSFPNAGTHILRDRDLYLLFNTAGAGVNGRGSHGHNDILSIEVSACGQPFIVDPGTYVYTANLGERQRFRSTAYHSTVQIDGIDQHTTDEQSPFVIGAEAQPKVLAWETSSERDRVSAEHAGYSRLVQPVQHRRTITLIKQDRMWRVEDEFAGTGEHHFEVRFHFDGGLEVRVLDEHTVSAYDKMTRAKLFVSSLNLQRQPRLEDQFVSRDYGSKQPSMSACWSVTQRVPFKLSWVILPVCSGEVEAERLGLLQATLKLKTEN